MGYTIYTVSVEQSYITLWSSAPAEGVIKVQMIADSRSESNKTHRGRGHVTFETRDLATRFCRKVGNTIVGGRNVVARMEVRICVTVFYLQWLVDNGMDRFLKLVMLCHSRFSTS